MKALIITILLVTINQQAQAECTLFCEQTKSSKLITQVVMLPVYFMGQTFLHETSHAVTGAALGMEIYTFKPYPHIGYNKNFVFGAVVFNNNYEKSSYSIQHLAPVILDLSMIITSDVLLTVIAKDSKLAPYILVGGMVAPTIDLLLWANGVTKNSEINQACARLNIWRPALTISLDLLAAVSIYRIIDNAKDIFSTNKKDNRQNSNSRFDITPTGISYTYTW